MLRRLLLSAVLLLITSRAQASPINLLLTVDDYAPIVGPPEISLFFSFFESPTNGWPQAMLPRTELASGSATLLPGVRQFNVSLNAASLDNVYFNAYGFYFTPGTPFSSIYVAEPPTGAVPDNLAFSYGPPWIPLANLGEGLSGDFRYIYGYSRGPIGTYQLTAVNEATPVPEPATLLLFGSGLAAVVAKRVVGERGGDRTHGQKLKRLLLYH
jgi:hypothetical protein